MIVNRFNWLFTLNFILIVSTLVLINNVDQSKGMKKKMFRKLKSMFSSKAKKLIILPIPIPFMMDDKKFGGGLGLMGGGINSMLSSTFSSPSAPQMDPWMMMSMMDCPEMMTMEDGGHKKPSSMGSMDFEGFHSSGKEGKTFLTPPSSYAGHHQEQGQSVDKSWGSSGANRGNEPVIDNPNFAGSGYRGGHQQSKTSTGSSNPTNYFKGTDQGTITDSLLNCDLI